MADVLGPRLPAFLQGPADFLTLRRRFASLRGGELAAYQREAARAVIDHAVSHSPFYRDLYEGHDLDAFASLPTVDKAAIMGDFDRVQTVGVTLERATAFALEMERSGDPLRYLDDRFVIGMSSGTSGSRGLVVTPRELTRRLPWVFAARSGIPLRLMPLRILFMLRVFSQGFADINGPGIRLEYANTMTPVPELVAKARSMRANVLTGPPSMLRMLTPHASTMPDVRMLVAYAEVLEERDEAAIRTAFASPLIQIYQASEGAIGCTCREGTLHVNEDLVYVELFDDDGLPVSQPGKRPARMLVTNLYNTAVPLIRYELNDLIELGPPCRCGSGFRTIARVVGRADDVLWFDAAGRHERAYVFPDLAARWIIAASDGVAEYQVTQEPDDSLTVRLQCALRSDKAGVHAAVEGALRQGLHRHGCVVPPVRIVEGAPVITSGGKLKRFTRKGHR